MQRFEATTSGHVIGAKISGVSLAAAPDPETLEDLESALERFGVLIFPEQDITPDQQVAFSRALAPLEKTQRLDARLESHPEIFVVGNTREKLVTFAPAEPGGELEWHTDHIHLQVPARASLLYALEVPPEGGDTLFSCLYSAYDDLDAETRELCDELQVVNSVSGLNAYLKRASDEGAAEGNYGTEPDHVIWPLVRHHPLTGRKGLYFGAQVSIGIVGWPEAKAREFIRDLTAHSTQEKYLYRHLWQQGDAVLWDNRRVLHAGTTYDVKRHRRLLHRTTLRETEPVA